MLVYYFVVFSNILMMIFITDAIRTRFSGDSSARRPIDWKTVNSKIDRYYTTKKYNLKSGKQKTANNLSAISLITTSSDDEQSTEAPL